MFSEIYKLSNERRVISMTNLDWLLKDEERSRDAFLNLRKFVDENDIESWWCENKCPVNDLCVVHEDEDGEYRKCCYEYGPDILDVLTDWCKAEHTE
jgi:hypothetical protein